MPIVEIAVSVNNRGPGRVQEGDISVVRKPSIGIGLNEMRWYLWLWIELGDIPALILADGYHEHKRRYAIDMFTLKKIRPDIDMGRVTDTFECYQPFVSVDRQTGLFQRLPESLPGQDLIIDKQTGRLLRG